MTPPTIPTSKGITGEEEARPSANRSPLLWKVPGLRHYSIPKHSDYVKKPGGGQTLHIGETAVRAPRMGTIPEGL